jgi:hypothetical protein
MAGRKPKTGRRAGENDRQIARKWAELYRKAQDQPGGRLCLNPEDDPSEQTWLDGHDPKDLLWLLESFAAHGTFDLVGKTFESIRMLPLRMRFKKLREEGATYEAAISDLAAETHVSTRTMERWLQNDKP